MQKRGQITIFIIVGIFIVAVLILVAVLKGGTIKTAVEKELSGTSTFTAKVEEVKDIVQACMDKSLSDGFRQFAVGPVYDYKLQLSNYVRMGLPSCVNFSGLGVNVITSQVEDVEIGYGAGNTKIMARALYSVTIMDDDNAENLKEFYSEINIIPGCCMPVEVDDDCVAVKSAKAVSCGRMFDVKEGDSLKKGGKCEAC
ncbi:MAG: hypothetical protein V1906_02855 [Candidatus Woesearchaeota archaeon]